MGGRSAESKALIRAKAPVDMGLLIQRTARMVEGTLDLLEVEYAEFQSSGKGIPMKFQEQLAGCTDQLNALTLAHSRYSKTDEDFWSRKSTPEKLEGLQNFLVHLHTEQPELVVQWLRNTVTLVGRNGDAVRAGAPNKRTWSQRANPIDKPEIESTAQVDEGY